MVLDAYDTVGRVRLGTGAQMMMGLVGEYMFFEETLFDTGDIFGKVGC